MESYAHAVIVAGSRRLAHAGHGGVPSSMNGETTCPCRRALPRNDDNTMRLEALAQEIPQLEEHLQRLLSEQAHLREVLGLTTRRLVTL